MEEWQQRGIPDNRAAWLHRVAKNRILESLRREKAFEKALAFSGQSLEGQAAVVDQWLEEERLPDSLLRMIFMCCHPTLERKTQIALALNTLCGFGIAEIARGLMLPDETVKKRLQRAKGSLAAANVSFNLPGDDQLTARLEVVHDVLYLMFNEGYSTSRGVEPICEDVCEEAVRLCHMLCESPCSSTTTRALFALLLFHAARLNARTNEEEAIILLEDQDRTKWDRNLIAMAQCWLVSSQADQPTIFHLEAAISMQHCISPSVSETDWSSIVRPYDRLLQHRDSPLYTLNRAIAAGQAGNPHEAMLQLQLLQTRTDMQNYQLLDCAIARLHELEGNRAAAIDYYLVASSKAAAPHEQEWLQRKLQTLTDNSPVPNDSHKENL
jgi:RNA polymerase sigma-70 factor (ECF subfamily)